MKVIILQINPVQFLHTPDVLAVNQEQFKEHQKLYEGYVKSINEISNRLKEVSKDVKNSANTTNGEYRGLKRGETYALNGVILHELYFRNMGGIQKNPDGDILKLIEQFFGSFDNWKDDFISTAKASRGWTILCFDQRTSQLRNLSLDTHDYGCVMFILPLIVLDMYEHAYFLQYATEKLKYIGAFMQNIHWDIVEQRLKLWNLMKEIEK